MSAPARRTALLLVDLQNDFLERPGVVPAPNRLCARAAELLQAARRQGLGHRTRRGHAVGLAWAARRSLLERHGLYDGCIMSGGDKAILIAALGRFELLDRLEMNERQTAHCLAWARPFFADVRGNIGYIDATLFHLWHGDLKDRRYRQRYVEFKRFGFDPARDITLDAHGCWRWTTDNAEMRAYLERYFEMRNEDGALTAGC